MVFNGGGKEIVHYHDTDLGTTALHRREREREGGRESEREREREERERERDGQSYVISSEHISVTEHATTESIILEKKASLVFSPKIADFQNRSKH